MHMPTSDARVFVQGTFLVRPSMSLAGTMVISAVTDGRVKHMALDGNQLDSRSLEVQSPSCFPTRRISILH